MHLDPGNRLTPDAEHARYLLHENNPDDPEYVAFLRRLGDPLIERLSEGARGLDFGCGPSPVLAMLLCEAGFPCEAYDPFFFPDRALLKRSYDFVACSEVIEHLYDPAATFTLFSRLLAPRSILGVMTRFYDADEAFAEWWYRRDPTHVCFYTGSTMEWIAKRYGWTLEIPQPNVAFFT